MKTKKSVLAIIMLIVILAVGIIAITLKQYGNSSSTESSPIISNFATGGVLDETNSTYDKFGSTGGYTPLVLNVSICQNGRDSAYFALGHTEFLVNGKNDGACIFEYGTEIENPSWDGRLDTKCSVPIDQKISLTVSDEGIDFTPIKQYCSNQ